MLACLGSRLNKCKGWHPSAKVVDSGDKRAVLILKVAASAKILCGKHLQLISLNGAHTLYRLAVDNALLGTILAQHNDGLLAIRVLGVEFAGTLHANLLRTAVDDDRLQSSSVAVGGKQWSKYKLLLGLELKVVEVQSERNIHPFVLYISLHVVNSHGTRSNGLRHGRAASGCSHETCQKNACQ